MVDWRNSPAEKTEDESWRYSPAAPDQPAQPEGDALGDYVMPTVNAVGSAIYSLPGAVAGAVQGKHDPRFKDVPQLEEKSGLSLTGTTGLAAVDDAAYGDVWEQTLKSKDRFIERFKDQNGYDIIRYKGQDGSPQLGYVNKPGLDLKDVGRGVDAAIPYLIGGGVASVFGKGLGAAGNVLLQGLFGAGTSVAQDVAARKMGSKQPLNVERALWSGGLSAGGELIGRVAIPFIKKWVGNKEVWETLPDGTLGLTQKGKLAAIKEGVDPNLIISKEQAKQVLDDSATALSPGEEVIKAQTGKYGVETSLGQRTKDPLQIQIEKDIRFGTLGDAARSKMTNRDPNALGLDQRQAAQMKAAALGDNTTEVGPLGFNPNQIGPNLSPGRHAENIGKDVLGESAQKGFLAAKEAAKKIEDAAWKKVEDITPKSGAFANMPAIMQKATGRIRIDPDNTPVAHSMSKMIRDYIEGNATVNPEVPDFLGQSAIKYVDDMRRTLLARKADALTPTDRTAANRLYEGYLKWIDDAAEKQLLTGGPEAALALRDARGATRKMRKLFDPKEKLGAKSAAARTMEKVENATTGEETLKALLGSGGAQSDAVAGAAKAIHHYKTATMKFGGKAGQDAWNDLRLAQWVKMVTDKQGEMLQPKMLSKTIKSMLKNKPSIMKAFYSKKELAAMKEYAGVADSINWTSFDMNPSGTGTVNRAGMGQKLAEEQIRFQAQSSRAKGTFGGDKKKLIESRIWRFLGSYVKNFEKSGGAGAADRATRQTLMKARTPAVGGYFGATAPLITHE